MVGLWWRLAKYGGGGREVVNSMSSILHSLALTSKKHKQGK